MQNIITFWMDKGVDGFRVDLASSLVKNDPDKSATIALWKNMTAWFKHSFPEGVLIAEWFNPKQSINAGFDIDFLKPGHLFNPLDRGEKTPSKTYFNKAGEGEIGKWYNDYKDQYESTLHKGYISLPTGNHDSPRISDHEKYIIAVNPSGESVTANINSQKSANYTYIFGTNKKCIYKKGKETDVIKLSPVSAAIFKLD